MHWTFLKNDLKNNAISIMHFVLQINNFAFVIFIILIMYIILRKPLINASPSLISYINTNENTPIDKSIKNYFEISKNSHGPVEIRISSLVKLAQYYNNLNQLLPALEAISNAKALAIIESYPESQLYGIRKVKTEIHFKLKQLDNAEKEILEVEQSKLSDSNENKEFYDMWIHNLKKIIGK